MSAALRVLLVTGAYFPEFSSGGLQCQAVARCLAGQVEFQVLTTAVDPALAVHETIDGVRVARVGIDVKSRRSRMRATVRMLVELFRIVPRVAVVHLHGCSQKNIPVVLVARLFGRPVVLSLHTAGHDEPDAVARQGRLAAWTFSAASLYLAVSPRLVDACRTAGLPTEKVQFVPNGVELDRFRPATADERTALRRSLGLPVDHPMVLCVGFFSSEKQPQVLFDAWLRLQRDGMPPSTLVFVGARRSKYFEVDEHLATDIRARAEREGVGDRVVFVDPTHRIEDYYRAADVFALPSSREGLPVSLLEAMASGLAAIASRLRGATDVMIEDGANGVLVPSGDAAALGAALGGLLADRDKAAAMGAAARARALRDYGVERTAALWFEAYRHVSATS